MRSLFAFSAMRLSWPMRFTKRGHMATADCLASIFRMGGACLGRTPRILSCFFDAEIRHAGAIAAEEAQSTPMLASRGPRMVRIQKDSRFEASCRSYGGVPRNPDNSTPTARAEMERSGAALPYMNS